MAASLANMTDALLSVTGSPNFTSATDSTEAKSGSMPELPRSLEVLYATVLAALFLVIFCSSALILAVVATNSRLHSLPGYLMAALALCDLLMAVTSIVPTVLTIASERWLFTSYGCSMQAFCLTYFGPLESSFIMLCALDRFSAIRSPLFYNQLEIYVLRFLKLIFMVGILVNLPIPITASVIAVTVQFNPQFSHCVYSFGGMWVVPLLNYVLQYIIPGLVIIFCYAYIAVAAFISKNKHLKAISTVNAPQGNNTESEFATSRLEEDELSNLENNNKKNKKNNKNETNNRNNNNNNNNNNSNNNHNMNGNDITHRDAINDVTGNNDVIRSDNDYLKIDGNSTCTPRSGKNGGSNGGNRRHISSLAANSYNFLRHLKLCKMLFIIAFVYFLSFLPSFVYGFLVTFGVLKFNIYIYKVIHFLTYINGALNALVYYSMSVVFKEGFHRTMKRFCPCLVNQYEDYRSTVKVTHDFDPTATEGPSRQTSIGLTEKFPLNLVMKKKTAKKSRTRIELDV